LANSFEKLWSLQSPVELIPQETLGFLPPWKRLGGHP
jgi:hypothetical protein